MESKEIPRNVAENQLDRFLDDSITELNTLLSLLNKFGLVVFLDSNNDEVIWQVTVREFDTTLCWIDKPLLILQLQLPVDIVRLSTVFLLGEKKPHKKPELGIS